MSFPKSERLVIVDIFKNICAIFIVTYHVWEAFLSDLNIDFSTNSALWYFYLIKKASSIGFIFSSLFIVSISFFLFGYKKSNLKLEKYLLFIPAHLLTLYNVNEAAKSNFIYWDIFAFIFTAYTLIHIASKVNKHIFDGFLLLGSMLFIPQISTSIKEIFTAFSFPQFIEIFWGHSRSEFTNGWFLIPWIFYPLFFYRVGIFAKENLSKLRVFNIYDLGTLLFIIICFFNFTTMNTNYEYTLKYDQFAFDTTSRQVLSILLIPLIILRISLLKKFNFQTQIFNNLWSNSFGIAYMFHFIAIIVLNDYLKFSMTLTNYLPLAIYFFVGYFPIFLIKIRNIFSKMEISFSKK